ncbi:hypothetical protein ACFQU2_34910 [Siccirubricoccus deserti]
MTRGLLADKEWAISLRGRPPRDHRHILDAIRQDTRDRGARPEILTRRNRKVQHPVNRRLHALRSRVELCINSRPAGVASGAEVKAALQFIEAFTLELMVGHQIGDDERGKADEEREHGGSPI